MKIDSEDVTSLTTKYIQDLAQNEVQCISLLKVIQPSLLPSIRHTHKYLSPVC